MANDSSKKNLGNLFLEDIWGKRDAGMRIPNIDWSNTIKHEDVEFLLNRYPFLQIVSTDPTFADEIQPAFITADSGWIVHDYGDALSSSPGDQLFGNYNPPEAAKPKMEAGEKENGGEGGGAGTGTTGIFAGKGTVINQAVMTAQEMIALAVKKGWPGVEIVAGTPVMQWAAWMTAEDYQFKVTGFTPSRLDRAKRDRVRKYLTEIAETYAPQFRR